MRCWRRIVPEAPGPRQRPRHDIGRKHTMYVLTITLNAAVDTTYVVEHFEPGQSHRVLHRYAMPGGKGNNVARVLRSRGHTVTATGFLGGDTGEFIKAGLADAGIAPRFTWLDGRASRTCHTVLEHASGRATEILESGPEVTPVDCERFLDALPALLEGVDAVAISGSAPTGTTRAFLDQLARIVRAGTPRMLVDSSGQPLEALLGGRPDVITPNEAELDALMGRHASLEARIAFAQQELIGKRMALDAHVLISMGSAGALLVTASGVIQARPPAIDVVNTVGCGDALLAGYIDACGRYSDSGDMLRQAVAFGTAAALQPVAGIAASHDIDRLQSRVEVSTLPAHQSEQQRTPL